MNQIENNPKYVKRILEKILAVAEKGSCRQCKFFERWPDDIRNKNNRIYSCGKNDLVAGCTFWGGDGHWLGPVLFTEERLLSEQYPERCYTGQLLGGKYCLCFLPNDSSKILYSDQFKKEATNYEKYVRKLIDLYSQLRYVVVALQIGSNGEYAVKTVEIYICEQLANHRMNELNQIQGIKAQFYLVFEEEIC